MYDENTGKQIVTDEEKEVLSIVDEWLAEGTVDDPDDDELMDIAAIMAAHEENPFG